MVAFSHILSYPTKRRGITRERHHLETVIFLTVGNNAARSMNEEGNMSSKTNKAIVRRYFEEALDKRNLDVLDEIITKDCIIHRPEASEPIRGREAFKHALERILQSV